MADEHQFIENGLQRSQIDEFFQEELGRAGYGGMDVAKTPMGTQIVLKAESPGWSSAKAARTSGRSRRLSRTEVQPRRPPDRRAGGRRTRPQRTNRRGPTGQRARAWLVLPEGRSHDDRPDHGRRRARREIVLSGKVTGARSRVEKFNRGYIKHNGEPAETVVDHGQGVAVMKLGTIGVDVKIIPPGAELPTTSRSARTWIRKGRSGRRRSQRGRGGVEELLEGRTRGRRGRRRR